MSNVIGITAHLQAKNNISPHLQEIVKVTRATIKEMLQLDDATQDMIKEMRRIKQVADQNERSFKREMESMQREVDDLRRKLGGLNSVKAHPRVNIDDQARREISAIRQEIKSLDGTKATVKVAAADGEASSFFAGGVAGGIAAQASDGLLDSLVQASQANARRAVMGATPDELKEFQRISQDLSLYNPNVDKTDVKDLMTQAYRFDDVNGYNITKQALQLNAIRPDMGGVDDYQKTLFAMQQSWKEIKDTGRFGDTLAEIAANTTDIRGEALDSIVEYSTQVTKFLDTPEKMAALMKEMNGLWSIDKGFDSIKEATIKLDNQGDLTNVLSTAYQAQGIDSDAANKKAANEAQIISKAIHSDNQADNQFAVAALLQNFGTIKDDKVRQQLLNELGGGPGEDVAKAYAPLLDAAGRIGTTDASQFNYKGKLNQQFQTLKDNDPLRGFLEAKTLLSNELIGLGTVIAQDISPALNFLSTNIKGAKEALDKLPTGLSLTVLATGIGLVTYGLWKLKVALAAATQAAIQRRLTGGDGPDIDVGQGGNNKKSGGKPGKKRGWNPFGQKAGPEPPQRKWLTSEEAKQMALYGSKATGAAEEVAQVSKLAKFGGAVKSIGGGLAKRLPLIGAAIGAGQIITSDNKLDTVGKVGSEALGGWAGAAAGGWAGATTGALIGSIVPGIGTAIGGAVGGVAGSIIGGIGGGMAGGWGWDKLKDGWSSWFGKTEDATAKTDELAKGMTSVNADIETSGRELAQSMRSAANQSFSAISPYPAMPFRPYANGGVIDRPHLGLVGEAGPEAIIPLSSNRRSRALQLYEQTGRALGVRAYANGGIVGGTQDFLADHGQKIAGFLDGIENSFKLTRKKMSTGYQNKMKGLYEKSRTGSLPFEEMYRRSHELRKRSGKPMQEFFTKLAPSVKWFGRFAKPLAYAADGSEIVSAHIKGDYKERNKGLVKMITSIGASMATGAVTGAAVGAVAGGGIFSPATAIVGTVVGALTGLAAGIAGEKLGEAIYDKWGGHIDKGISAVGGLARAGYARTSSFIGGGYARVKDWLSWGGKRYANGGVIDRPHLGLVGEAGPEAIIPLSAGRRNRALELYEQTGRHLGVRPYANGGIVGGIKPLRSQMLSPNAKQPVIQVQLGSVNVDAEINTQVDDARIAKALQSPLVKQKLSKVFSEVIIDAIETQGGVA